MKPSNFQPRNGRSISFMSVHLGEIPKTRRSRVRKSSCTSSCMSSSRSRRFANRVSHPRGPGKRYPSGRGSDSRCIFTSASVVALLVLCEASRSLMHLRMLELSLFWGMWEGRAGCSLQLFHAGSLPPEFAHQYGVKECIHIVTVFMLVCVNVVHYFPFQCFREFSVSYFFESCANFRLNADAKDMRKIIFFPSSNHERG